jgi:Protein of unknown function (DUF4013)
MDYGKIVGDSFDYAKEGLEGKWRRWFLLLISCIIFPLIMGYMMRIYRGATPAPEPDQWGSLFLDGIRLLVVGIVYALPVIILGIAILGSAGIVLFMEGANPYTNPEVFIGLLGAIFIGVLILLIVAIIIGLFSTIAYVRFARTGSFGEAFNFGAIIDYIGKIGWLSYILALVILVIIVSIIKIILMTIPFIGIILLFLLSPFIILFAARYITLVYDSAKTV